MYNKALEIAYNAHSGQTRRDSCVPYIVHPIRVSQKFQSDFEKTIAILHDVVEDTDITIKDLKKHFPYPVINEVDALTRRDGEKHFDYIERVAEREIATKIKIADIVDNLSDSLSVQPKSMIERYNKSLEILIKN